MTRITSDDVRKVANLARLAISEEDIRTYSKQLEEILEYIAQLEKIDTKEVPPTTRAVEVVNVMRDDIVDSSDIRDKLLNLAPKREGEFYRVPKILSD
ncbi:MULTISPECIES: Asp-tRNA(Asn)/Glu-tRNA(Gln) amidotransferase subunit GatC [unclassified Prochlorococcus]|uniref:Asp-tRNA(Asn)/Glu-tRNA(Gln) amidotransferase subunit GatC n=1 Tax=unclassified Prochlorococcus TaxID=2627481 RepID=UPI000533BCF0|nr:MULTISPECIES: Asp-tRNA(Asn)/Glu-tRNA(Gln) amidotransferase subunit GatC [unclassified Prochlorococcus]KGG16696.1 Aspartyl-tRNA(Asn) amidotransferase subunit C Glutamyl-tRNA(Gln) amidotransferase subunit C [Prochlorococcus sp. MIT 0602]KGG18332.1 Aspartyl-tRNA(Asn) amidotransferase subunit C Glutamyl-tRNA(Gln) amidotransferase subunit C [Prochlorococcus sp. MIT 0603]